MESKLGLGVEGGAPGDARSTLDSATFHGFGVSHVPKCLKLRRPEDLDGDSVRKEVGAVDELRPSVSPVRKFPDWQVFTNDAKPRWRNVREIRFVRTDLDRWETSGMHGCNGTPSDRMARENPNCNRVALTS